MTDETSRNLHSDVYCYCSHALNCSLCGKPRDSRTSTQEAIRHILEDLRPVRSNVFGNGPLLVSDIPVSAKQQQQPEQPPPPIVLGIDEAGRGSVLGPMVYGLAYWSVDATDRIPTSFNDSKQLSEQQREKIWEEILQHKDIGFAFKALLPNEISRNMLRSPTPYNLNEQSHDTAMILIRKLQPHHTIQACYIDTVGNADYYKRKLEREFPGIEFTVESKADAKYAPCSAASVGKEKCMHRWDVSLVCRMMTDIKLTVPLLSQSRQGHERSYEQWMEIQRTRSQGNLRKS
jgi:ribonuclease H